MDTHTTSSSSAVLTGAADGAAATLAMSGVMLGAARAGWMGELPPRRVARRALRRTLTLAPRRTNDALGAAAHLAFGAVAGALFESVTLRWRQRPVGPVAGAAYGAAVWLVSYAGWMPALGVLPPPHRDRAGRQGWMLVAHLVYGAVLGGLARRRALGPRRGDEEMLSLGLGI